jgi:hypothetical protein
MKTERGREPLTGSGFESHVTNEAVRFLNSESGQSSPLALPSKIRFPPLSIYDVWPENISRRRRIWKNYSTFKPFKGGWQSPSFFFVVVCCLAESCVSTRETVAVKGTKRERSGDVLRFDCRCAIDEGLSQSLRIF